MDTNSIIRDTFGQCVQFDEMYDKLEKIYMWFGDPTAMTCAIFMCRSWNNRFQSKMLTVDVCFYGSLLLSIKYNEDFAVTISDVCSLFQFSPKCKYFLKVAEAIVFRTLFMYSKVYISNEEYIDFKNGTQFESNFKILSTQINYKYFDPEIKHINTFYNSQKTI